MGSKRKLAPTIIQYILMHNETITDLYDLFGGGAAISHEALKYKRIKTHYNEIDPAICELLKKLSTDGVTEEMYQWIDRETFHKHKNGTDWFAGLIKTCWSFGNRGITYLYGEEIEPQKKEWHNQAMKDGHKLAQKNRLKLKQNPSDRLDIQHLENIQHFKPLQNLHITNLSYEQVPISGKTPILYLDPPYQDTGSYQNAITLTLW